MSPRAYVYSLAAFVMVVVPALAQAQVAPAFSVNGGAPVAAGTTVSAVCTASQYGTFVKYNPSTATFSGAGAFSPATTTFPGPVSGSATVTSSWTAPATAGTYTVDCTVNWTSPTSPVRTTTISVVVETPPPSAPVISSFSVPGSVTVGAVNKVSVTLDDPAATISWTATGGTFADSSAASTTWTAPSTVGTYTITVTAANAGGSAIRNSAVTVALSIYQGSLSAPMQYPRRVVATASGDLLVVDDTGALLMLTKRGDRKGSMTSLGATAVAAAPDGAWVATKQQGILKFDPATGRTLGRIKWTGTAVIGGLAWDAQNQVLWAAVVNLNRAVALRADGTVALEITRAENRALRNLSDVAFDGAGTLWVAERDGSTGNRVHAFNAADGSYLRSMVTAGTDAGQVVDTGGIALDGNGKIYVSDAYGGTVQVMSTAGASLGTIGTKGDADGYLLHPRGLAFMANGDLAIANAWFDRIDRFGSGADLPTCAGDSDCDGLPDDWERANGLDPYSANDALLDLDGDGLSNLEEYALKTDPRKTDTDGDGFSDRAEVLAGFNPLDPLDHRPAVAGTNLGQVPPGLVRLSSVLANGGGCAASWRQVAGAKAALRDASTFSPSFIARAAGSYKFEVVATCAGATSAPAAVEVEVVNVAPLADAGRLVVASPGRTVNLSSAFSSDANGDALAYAWDQVAGPAIAHAGRGAALAVRPMREGYYAFELTATDKAGLAAKAVVGVAVVDDALPVAVVSAATLSAVAGGTVTLDASASAPADATFAWQQVEGAPVGAIAASAAPTVSIPSPGRYVFEVTAGKNGVLSPPARVVVLAGNGGVVPTAVASAPATGAVNAVLTLDGSGSAGASAWAWRQLAGPAAGLTGADAAVATVVPFSAGNYAFELVVADTSGAVSAPAMVRIAVTAAGKPLPVASITAPATAVVGELVILNARASANASRYRWSQLAGPWVALDASSGSPAFTPPSAGRYTFELVVDDGSVRSAPATVSVDVQ